MRMWLNEILCDDWKFILPIKRMLMHLESKDSKAVGSRQAVEWTASKREKGNNLEYLRSRIQRPFLKLNIFSLHSKEPNTCPRSSNTAWLSGRLQAALRRPSSELRAPRRRRPLSPAQPGPPPRKPVSEEHGEQSVAPGLQQRALLSSFERCRDRHSINVNEKRG